MEKWRMERRRMVLVLGMALLCLSACGMEDIGAKLQADKGVDFALGTALGILEEKGFCGCYSFCSGRYAYDMKTRYLLFEQYDLQGHFVRRCGEKKGKKGKYRLLLVNDRELFYGEDVKEGFVLWKLALKNSGTKAEVPDWENPVKLHTIPGVRGAGVTALFAQGDIVAGFFDAKYMEFDQRTGKNIPVSTDRGQKFYDFGRGAVDRDYSDYRIPSTHGSDSMECGAVLLRTGKRGKKGDLYLHRIGSGVVQKVAENVYYACGLASGEGKFIYWGITGLPNSYWQDKFDGIWVCDAVTGKQEQLFSKERIDKLTTALSAGRMFVDANGRLYFEVSADQDCGLGNRKILSCPLGQPDKLRLEKEMTERFQWCQYVRSCCEDILFIEDGDGEYDEYIYRYHIKSGKATKEPKDKSLGRGCSGGIWARRIAGIMRSRSTNI